MSEGPRPLDQYGGVGSRISAAFSVYGLHFATFVLVAAANLPFAIARFVVPPGVSLLLLIPDLIVQGIVGGALILVFYQAWRGRKPTVHASFTAATDKLGALIEYFLRTGGAALLLAITVVGIPWAIRLVVRWFFGPQAIMIQNATPTQAISESCRLVTGNWWRTFGNLLLLFLFALPGTVAALAIGGVPGLVVASLSSVLVAPIYACAMTLYYMRLLQEKAAVVPPPAEAPAA